MTSSFAQSHGPYGYDPDLPKKCEQALLDMTDFEMWHAVATNEAPADYPAEKFAEMRSLYAISRLRDYTGTNLVQANALLTRLGYYD